MRIVGHGVDIVELRRVERLLSDADFLSDWFTSSEQAGAGSAEEQLGYYAGRIAAKEAIAKAIGTGFTQGIGWTDIEVIRAPIGTPQVVLYGRALETSEKLGLKEWFLSISHSEQFAIASAIAVGQ